MKILKIREYEVKVDDDLYELLKSKRWHVVKRGTFYMVDGNHRYMHRLIMGVTDPEIFVDHKDRDTLNNQRENLRPCTRQENRHNSKNVSYGESKYIGVFRAYVSKKTGKIRWMTRVVMNKKTVFCGYYETELEAARMYNEKALEIRGEFANLNDLSQP